MSSKHTLILKFAKQTKNIPQHTLVPFATIDKKKQLGIHFNSITVLVEI